MHHSILSNIKAAVLCVLILASTAACSKRPSVEFGLLKDETIVATREIRHQIGTEYGLRITFPKNDGVMKLKMEFNLPGPANWTKTQGPEGGPVRELTAEASPDGSRLLSETEIDTSLETQIFHRFRIIEGDPAGEHTINLWLNDAPLETITFQIKK